MQNGSPVTRVVLSVCGETSTDTQALQRKLVHLREWCRRVGLSVEDERADHAVRRKGGRPKKQIDVDRLKTVLLARNGLGWRRLADRYNEGLPLGQQVSVALLYRVAKQLRFDTLPTEAHLTEHQEPNAAR